QKASLSRTVWLNWKGLRGFFYFRPGFVPLLYRFVPVSFQFGLLIINGRFRRSGFVPALSRFRSGFVRLASGAFLSQRRNDAKGAKANAKGAPIFPKGIFFMVNKGERW